MFVPRSLRLGGIATTFLLAAATAQAQFSSPMRDVENPDRFPYAETVTRSIDPPFLNNFLQFPTPAGKRYVIEYVSLRCTTPSASDSFPQATLITTKITSPTSATSNVAEPFQMTRRGPGSFGGFVWAGAAVVKMYSDSSASFGSDGISFNVFHTDTSVAPSCTGTVTGHTITP